MCGLRVCSPFKINSVTDEQTLSFQSRKVAQPGRRGARACVVDLSDRALGVLDFFALLGRRVVASDVDAFRAAVGDGVAIGRAGARRSFGEPPRAGACLLYTSDAAD